jgi:cell division septum initiation protein DivIVA
MATEKKTMPIFVDDVEYTYEDMTDEQKSLVNHIADLDRKIGTTQFNLDQLNVGKSAFVNLLKEALNEQPAEVN